MRKKGKQTLSEPGLVLRTKGPRLSPPSPAPRAGVGERHTVPWEVPPKTKNLASHAGVGGSRRLLGDLRES